mmetsp:Transcript_78608/g.172335  ORF Transcript_78608/g.172335 Transcript_78608/m.172335 type:complete len:84 (+) Transcript_78608:235-486(+)
MRSCLPPPPVPLACGQEGSGKVKHERSRFETQHKNWTDHGTPSIHTSDYRATAKHQESSGNAGGQGGEPPCAPQLRRTQGDNL